MKGNDLRGKTFFVTGGSGGLGRAISKLLIVRGAHITIFGRRPGPLIEAREELLAARLDDNQQVDMVAIDMSDYTKVHEAFVSQRRTADVLYCVAGGNHAENGFLVDIPARALETCMANNYFASAYAAKAILDIWVDDDEKEGLEHPHPRVRKIVFIASAAAFLSSPGSIAYTRKSSFA
ncbi:hypothetical protein FOXYS1_34 [Fusarium oxysporum]|uniref:Uncharacterized protein n=1 Tax=Fusarium oxysporum TaxID=5507 RepID=A0A8H5APT6_FUSOX|nr:hypothetical protein FOXYS1_34 [Fusarium oxysporum]